MTAASAYSGPERRRFINRSWPLPAFAAWAACWIVFASVAQLGARAGRCLRRRRPRRRGARADRRDAVATRLRRLRLSALVRRPVGQRRRAAGVGLAAAAGAARASSIRCAPGATRRSSRPRPARCAASRKAFRSRRARPCSMPAAASAPAWSSCAASIRDAALEGIEWSWPLWLACALRAAASRASGAATSGARDWSRFALVYLFQRPESMARAAAKAAHELQPGAWLASLEFEIATLQPQLVLDSADGRRVWLYRAPFRRARAEAPARSAALVGALAGVLLARRLAALEAALLPGSLGRRAQCALACRRCSFCRPSSAPESRARYTIPPRPVRRRPPQSPDETP